MERIIGKGFIEYVEILMEEDKYRSVRGGYYTKEWKEVSDKELENELHRKVREIGKEYYEYIKSKEEDENSINENMENSMKIYGNEKEWKKAIRQYKKRIVLRTKSGL